MITRQLAGLLVAGVTLAALLAAGVLFFSAAANSRGADAAPAVFALEAPESVDVEQIGGPLLVRELVRQSFLIAARDDLGVSYCRVRARRGLLGRFRQCAEIYRL